MNTKQSFVSVSAVLLVLLTSGGAGAGLFEDAVSGGEEQEEKVESGMFTGSQLELNGYVRGDLFLGKVPDQDVTEIKTGFAEIAAKLKARLGETGDGHAELRLRHGYEWGEVQGDLNLREAYVNLYLGPADFRFGHQIIAWGRADGFNPTDNLTPRDMRILSPDEDDIRAANLALRTTVNLDPVRWELVYVPFYAPAHFPVPEQLGPIAFADPVYPDTDFEHGIAATRLNLELSAIDFSLSYLFGYSTFPGLSLMAFELGSSPEVGFRAYQHHVLGFDFSTSLGEFAGLRGEAALRWPMEVNQAGYVHVPLREIQYVLGIDKEIGDFYLIVQYVGKYVLDFEEIQPTGLMDLMEKMAAGASMTDLLIEAQDDEELAAILANILTNPEAAATTEVRIVNRMIAGQLEQVYHQAFGRLQWKLFQETLSLEIAGMYNFSTEEWMLRPKLAYSIADVMNLIAGAVIYGGPDDTMFGMVDEIMSAGFVELKTSF